MTHIYDGKTGGPVLCGAPPVIGDSRISGPMIQIWTTTEVGKWQTREERIRGEKRADCQECLEAYERDHAGG